MAKLFEVKVSSHFSSRFEAEVTVPHRITAEFPSPMFSQPSRSKKKAIDVAMAADAGETLSFRG